MSHKLVSLYIGDGEYYTRTDADTVIAELQSKLEAKELEFANLKEDALNTDNAREKWLQLARKQAMELRHQKLKRCLAMAKLAVKDDYAPWNMKWHKRWLELAEMFK